MSSEADTNSSGIGFKLLQESDFYVEGSILHPLGESTLYCALHFGGSLTVPLFRFMNGSQRQGQSESFFSLSTSGSCPTGVRRLSPYSIQSSASLWVVY